MTARKFNNLAQKLVEHAHKFRLTDLDFKCAASQCLLADQRSRLYLHMHFEPVPKWTHLFSNTGRILCRSSLCLGPTCPCLATPVPCMLSLITLVSVGSALLAQHRSLLCASLKASQLFKAEPQRMALT